MLRQPIVAVMGHVDHGKTSLLDKIRGSIVAKKEAGGITQHVGATVIPTEKIKCICGDLLNQLNINVDVPGLLFLDSPGHAAFTTIRKRGSSIADLAILVVDINDGFKPQTEESLKFLKEFKTPFLIAATKIDMVSGWVPYKEKCFFESFKNQPDHVKKSVEEKLYKLVGQLSERGFNSERFDRVDDFKKSIAIVPCSGVTGEGIPELLMILSGLAQNFLKDKLEVTPGVGKGSILEIKDVTGLGTTADIILYDGEINKGDYLVVGGSEPFATKIKALLKPEAMKEIRVEKKFKSVDKEIAAVGIKVSALDLDKAVAGSPIIACKEKDVEKYKEELKHDVEAIEFDKVGEGVILKADTLGTLEALVHILKEKGVEIKKADVGAVTRKDVVEIENVKDKTKQIIFAFNVNVSEDVMNEIKDKKLKLIKSDIIYRLIEEHEKHVEDIKKEEKMKKLDMVTLPARIYLMQGMTFRASGPAIVGVEVLGGKLKVGAALVKEGKKIGTVKGIQSEGTEVDEAKTGDRVAVSIEGPTVGRQIKEGDELVTNVTKKDVVILEELKLGAEVNLAKQILGLI